MVLQKLFLCRKKCVSYTVTKNVINVENSDEVFLSKKACLIQFMSILSGKFTKELK